MPDFHVPFRDLLRAVNLRHGTTGFTSLPKEGVLRIFSPSKIRRPRPGLNPRTWVPTASTLPLDHPSRKVNCNFFLIILREFGIFELIICVVFFTCTTTSGAMSWLRRLVAGLSPYSHRFIPRPAYLGFVVDKVILGHIWIYVLLFHPVSVILTRKAIYCGCYQRR